MNNLKSGHIVSFDDEEDYYVLIQDICIREEDYIYLAYIHCISLNDINKMNPKKYCFVLLKEGRIVITDSSNKTNSNLKIHSKVNLEKKEIYTVID